VRSDALEKCVAPSTVALFLALQGADRTLPLSWMVLTFGGLLSALLGAVDFQRPLSTIEKGMAVALAGLLLSAGCGLDPQRSLLLSVPMLASVLLWVLSVRDRDARFGFVPVVIGLAIAASVQSTLLLLAVLRNPSMTPADWVIDAGAAWLVVPNDLAWIACVLPLLAMLARDRVMIALCVLLVGFLALCALVHSRTAAVVAAAVAISFATSFLRLSQSRRDIKRWVIAAGVLGAVILAVFSAASMRARVQLWGAAWAMFLDHPWTGVGIHNFVLAYRQYLPPHAELIDPRITPWPHNLILEIAAECGLIGGIAILFLVGCLLRRGFVLGRTTLIPMQRAALAGLLGMGLLGLVEASLLRQWVWLLGTAMCALMFIDDNPSVHGKGNNAQQRVDKDAAIRGLRRAPGR
jgi:O-antigen ligase